MSEANSRFSCLTMVAVAGAVLAVMITGIGLGVFGKSQYDSRYGSKGIHPAKVTLSFPVLIGSWTEFNGMAVFMMEHAELIERSPAVLDVRVREKVGTITYQYFAAEPEAYKEFADGRWVAVTDQTGLKWWYAMKSEGRTHRRVMLILDESEGQQCYVYADVRPNQLASDLDFQYLTDLTVKCVLLCRRIELPYSDSALSTTNTARGPEPLAGPED